MVEIKKPIPLPWPAGLVPYSRHVLIVDDEPNIRRLTTLVLVRSGYQVDTANDGVDAWAALRMRVYDLLITDYDMPRLSGADLIKKVREARMNLPIILITGLLPSDTAIPEPSHRPAATLLKPFAIGEFLETVRSILQAAGPVGQNRHDGRGKAA